MQELELKMEGDVIAGFYGKSKCHLNNPTIIYVHISIMLGFITEDIN
jgi:hypothetical protein